jgi:hypothetical protein
MASKQNSLGLPDDQNTLRTYLDGVYHFVRWCELQIALGMAGPIANSPGRLFLVFQQILEPCLAIGSKQKEGATHFAAAFPSVLSTENPFEVTPAFLAIQPFLDHEEISTRLANCRVAAETVGPIPSSLRDRGPLPHELPRAKISQVKSRRSPTAKEQELCQQQLVSHRKQQKEKYDTVVAAFERLLDPFRALAQRIVLKIAGMEQPGAPAGEDDSAYALVSVLKHIDNRLRTDKKFQKILRDHPEIRRKQPLSKKGEPHPRRLVVHAGDLIRFLHAKDSEAIDTDDAKPASDDAPVLDNPDVDQRRSEILKGKGVAPMPYNTRPDLDRHD